MPRAAHPVLFRGSRRAGFVTAYPRIPTILSAGIVVALLIALGVAGFFLSSELVDASTYEEGADPETLVLSATVIFAMAGCGLLLAHFLRRTMSAERARKRQPVSSL